MHVKPNKTVVRGRVKKIVPEPDGWGATVELEVLRNESPSQAEDFLRPKPGTVLSAFFAEPDKLHAGDLVLVQASLAAGPFGGRAVVESVEPASTP